MYSLTLTMPYSLYGRNASKFNYLLNAFDAEVWLEKKDCNRRCNAKSILGLLSLGVEKDDNVVITTNSEQHEVIFDKIMRGFDEE